MKYICLEISTTDRSMYSTIKKKIERIYNSYEIKIYEVEAAEVDDESFLGGRFGLKRCIYEVVIGYTKDEVEKRIIKILEAHKGDINSKKEPSHPESSWFDWDILRKK